MECIRVVLQMCRYRNIITKHGKPLGVSRSAISAWKKNKTIPRGDVLAKMSCYFNAPIECLLGLPEKNDHQNTVSALFNALDSENQKSVLLYMEFALSKQKARTLAGG